MLPDGSVVVRGRLHGSTGRPHHYGRDRVVLLRERQLGRPDRRTGLVRYRLDALFGAMSGPARWRMRRVATFTGDGGAVMGTDGREVAVAWLERRGQGSPPGYRLRVALGRENRGFGRPQTLASWPFPRIDDDPTFRVAYGARGDLLVAFTVTRREGRRDRRLVAARVRRRGEAFGRTQVLGSRQASTELKAAVARNGRMVVAWTTQDGGEGVEHPLVARAAVRPPGRRFGRVQLLDAGGALDRAPGGLFLGMTPDGRATAAWSNATGAWSNDTGRSYPIRTASTGRTGGFGQVTQLADKGGVDDLAVAPDGSAVIAWSPYDGLEEGPVPLYAQIRPSGAAAFGAVEQISPPHVQGAVVVQGADVEYDPRTARPVAFWNHLDLSSPVAHLELLIAARTG